MKAKYILLVFLLSFGLLLLGTQVRYRSLMADIPVSQFLFAIAAFILIRKGVLKGRWRYTVIPLSVVFWSIVAFFIDNIFSNFHDWKFISIGTPNLFLCIVGATYGALLASEKIKRITGSLLLIASGIFSGWYMLGGNEYWFNYAFDGTFTGKVSDEKSYNWYKLVDTSGATNEVRYKDKLVVLDFWNVSCVTCYRKFPYLDSLTRQYSSDTNVVFIAVNLPVANDETRVQKVQSLKGKYIFRNVFADTAAARMFDINGVPVVLILKENKLLYKGSIELVAKYLAEARRPAD